jgi:cation diffusion facilitator CzcD-associated flavoprotein CzcO
VLGDLTKYKIPRPQWGPFSARRVPLIDVGFVNAVKRGLIQIRPALARLTESQAVFADRSSEPFDVIIAATGFASNLPRLLGAGDVLDQSGEPIAKAGDPTAQPGFIWKAWPVISASTAEITTRGCSCV